MSERAMTADTEKRTASWLADDGLKALYYGIAGDNPAPVRLVS